jgi:hypothetical protein
MQILKRAILFICPNLDENKSTALLWEEINALAIHKSIRIAIFVYTIPIALSIWAIASYAIFPYLGEELTGLRFVVLVGLIALLLFDK